jgi:hypothetical protein
MSDELHHVMPLSRHRTGCDLRSHGDKCTCGVDAEQLRGASEASIRQESNSPAARSERPTGDAPPALGEDVTDERKRIFGLVEDLVDAAVRYSEGGDPLNKELHAAEVAARDAVRDAIDAALKGRVMSSGLSASSADEVAALRSTVENKEAHLNVLLGAVNEACAIIELGDQRLLASDGDAGGQPPDLSLAEWRKLYVTLERVRGLTASPVRAQKLFAAIDAAR